MILEFNMIHRVADLRGFTDDAGVVDQHARRDQAFRFEYSTIRRDQQVSTLDVVREGIRTETHRGGIVRRIRFHPVEIDHA